MAKSSCVDCTTPESVPKTEVLYSKGEPSPRRLRKHIRLSDPVSGYSLYPCSDEYKTGFYLIAPQEANNLVTNPTFYVDLDGWSTFNSQVVRTNDLAFDSGFSLRINGSGDVITAERREYAEILTTEFLAGQPYTFSMYGWTPIIWDLSDDISLTISIVDDLGNEVFSDPISKPNKWERLSVTTVIDVNATEVYLRVNLRSQDQRENQPPFDPTGDYNLANEYAFFDMAQFEFGVEATTPFHGDTNTCASCDTHCGGYEWNGVPHKSSSHRDECVRDGGKLICFSDLGFDITSHTGHDAPPVRDISFPLNNRPGEFYQKSVADARILTFTGQICESTLKDLECAINELGNYIFPGLNPCSCCGKFLLVYHHEECDRNECDPERDLAICVSYIGGLEGTRTNLYHQQIALQFKAHDPFWFEWPGHSSQALDFVKVVTTPNIVEIGSDGTARGFPIASGNNYTSIACRPGINSLVIGGDFDSINGDPERCEQDIAIYNCDTWEDLCLGFAGGQINQLTSDGQGNILVAGSFSAPCIFVAVIYEDNTIGCFPGYPGGEAHAIAAPFWSQVIVGDDNGIYVQDQDDNWTTYVTNGRVENFAVDAAGNIYAVGQFTTVDGIQTGSMAKLNVNTEGCLDIDNAEWEGLSYTFNGDVTALDINKETGTIYLGGNFTQATPLPVDICQVTNGTKIDSNGSDQILTFTALGGDNYQLRVDFLNIVTRNHLVNCADYFRITGQSTFGTTYSFLLGPHNATFNSQGSQVIGPNTFYYAVYDIDVGIDLGDPCATLNEPLIDELDQTRTDIATFAALTLPGGLGIDNTLSKISAQCITVEEQFQGDTIDLNHVAQIQGGSLLPMGEGLNANVNVIRVHGITGEVWAGTDQGLYIWNGLFWGDFPGQLAGSNTTAVLDLKTCDDGCSMLILFDGTSASAVQGTTSVFYNGDVQPTDFNLIVHGPAHLQSFTHNGSKNSMGFCTVLECNEIANLDFNSGIFNSNHRSNLAPSILGGSRYDICLDHCKPNDISMYLEDDDAQTKATLIWREAHMGISALCCKAASSSLQTTGSQASPEALICDNTEYLEMHRDPTEDDCRDQGISEGTVWYNALSQCGLFIATGDCGCETEEEFEGGWTLDDGSTLTYSDGTVICPEDDIDCEDFA